MSLACERFGIVMQINLAIEERDALEYPIHF